MRIWTTTGALLLIGCSFDSGAKGGGGETEGSTGSSSGSEGSSVSVSTTATSMSSSSTTAMTSTTGPSSTTTGDTTSAVDDSTGGSTTKSGTTSGESSTGDPCANPPPVQELLWVDGDATTQDMDLVESMVLPDGPNGPVIAARSYAEGVGTATFPFDAACEGRLFFWGLVWDENDGINQNNADSFYFTFDEVPTTNSGMVWLYGCGTEGMPDGSWSWQPLANVVEIDNQNGCVDGDIDPPQFTAGPHDLVLLNRESGFDLNFAAIAALVVSDDPDFDPATLYDPNG